VTGLDLSVDAGFNNAMQYFGIERIDHEISLDCPLPMDVGYYDLITAFLTTFNRKPDRRTWDGNEWNIFLDKIKPHLTDNGIIFVQFNKDHYLNQTYAKGNRSETPLTAATQPDQDEPLFAVR